MTTDFNQPPEKIVLDLIGQANGVEIPLEAVSFTLAVAHEGVGVNGEYNTVVGVQARPGFEGQVINANNFKYRRTPLDPLAYDDRGKVLRPMGNRTSDVIAELNDGLGLQLTNMDFVNYPLTNNEVAVSAYKASLPFQGYAPFTLVSRTEKNEPLELVWDIYLEEGEFQAFPGSEIFILMDGVPEDGQTYSVASDFFPTGATPNNLFVEEEYEGTWKLTLTSDALGRCATGFGRVYLVDGDGEPIPGKKSLYFNLAPMSGDTRRVQSVSVGLYHELQHVPVMRRLQGPGPFVVPAGVTDFIVAGAGAEYIPPVYAVGVALNPVSIAYTGNAWVIAGWDSSVSRNRVYMSTDGEVWNEENNVPPLSGGSESSRKITRIAAGGGAFVLVVGNSDKAFIKQGNDWILRTLPYNGNWSVAAYRADIDTLMIIDLYGANAFQSTNGGFSWFEVTPPNENVVGWASTTGAWYVGGSNCLYIGTQTAGTDVVWERRDLPVGTPNGPSLQAYGAAGWLGCSGGNGDVLLLPQLGDEMEYFNSVFEGQVSSVTASPICGYCVVSTTSNQQITYVSADGRTWNEVRRVTDTGNYRPEIAGATDRIISVTPTTGSLQHTFDGSTWTAVGVAAKPGVPFAMTIPALYDENGTETLQFEGQASESDPAPFLGVFYFSVKPEESHEIQGPVPAGADVVLYYRKPVSETLRLIWMSNSSPFDEVNGNTTGVAFTTLGVKEDTGVISYHLHWVPSANNTVPGEPTMEFYETEDLPSRQLNMLYYAPNGDDGVPFLGEGWIELYVDGAQTGQKIYIRRDGPFQNGFYQVSSTSSPVGSYDRPEDILRLEEMRGTGQLILPSDVSSVYLLARPEMGNFEKHAFGVSMVPKTATNGTLIVSLGNSEGNSKTVVYSNTANGQWSSGNIPGSPWSIWQDLVYGNGRFVALSSSSDLDTAASTGWTMDGQTWMTGQLPLGEWRKLAFGAGLFVAIQEESETYATSTDGQNWSIHEFDAGPLRLAHLTFGAGVFLAVGDSTAPSAWKGEVSGGAITWSEVTLPGALTEPAYSLFAKNRHLVMDYASGALWQWHPDFGWDFTADVLPGAASMAASDTEVWVFGAGEEFGSAATNYAKSADLAEWDYGDLPEEFADDGSKTHRGIYFQGKWVVTADNTPDPYISSDGGGTWVQGGVRATIGSDSSVKVTGSALRSFPGVMATYEGEPLQIIPLVVDASAPVEIDYSVANEGYFTVAYSQTGF
jgi:hypothetical protein